jgi:Transmembrane exosortase (Exosortase_EpsH)
MNQLITWVIFFTLLICNYLATIKWMMARWDEHESYMAHGWLILPISIWLLWQEREKLSALGIIFKSSKPGFIPPPYCGSLWA